MENLAYYSSNGRIRQLIIFDTEDIEGRDENAVIKALNTKYDFFIEKLNEDRISNSEITVWILYMTDRDDLEIPGCRKSDSGWGCFLQVKDGFKTTWVQDIMHVVKVKEEIQLLLEFSIGGTALKKISSEIPVLAGKVKSVHFTKNNLPQGGDYARIKSLKGGYENDYGIDGATIGQDLLTSAPSQLNIDPEKYFILDWKQLSSLGGKIAKQRFFHLDLYMTFVGQDLDSKTNIILLPNLIFEHSISSPEFCEIQKKVWAFSSDLMGLGLNEDLSFIFIPLIRLSSSVVLSYNNCLVENYEIDGQRQIRIYFPDYRRKAKAIIKKALSGLEVGTSDKISWDELKSDLATAYTNYYPGNDNPLFSPNIHKEFGLEFAVLKKESIDIEKIATGTVNEIIDKAEDEITRKLGAWNIKISFVNLHCDYFAKRQGSLHCLTKVIERDCLS